MGSDGAQSRRECSAMSKVKTKCDLDWFGSGQLQGEDASRRQERQTVSVVVTLWTGLFGKFGTFGETFGTLFVDNDLVKSNKVC